MKRMNEWKRKKKKTSKLTDKILSYVFKLFFYFIKFAYP